MIKAIAFDYAGVITPGPMTQWVKDNLIEGSEKMKLYKEYARKWDRGEMSEQEVFKILEEITGIRYNEIWKKIYLKPKLNEDVFKLIKNLKKNYKVFLFSNFVASFLKKLLSNHNIADYFDEIIISSEHKMQKPEPHFFALLLSITSLKKDEIIFIDDTLRNVEAGNDFGIKSIQYVNVDKLEKDLENEGVKI